MPERYGIPSPGDKVVYMNRNGYPFQRETANKVMEEGMMLTVRHSEVGGWCTTLYFEEVSGSYNSVMFDLIEQE